MTTTRTIWVACGLAATIMASGSGLAAEPASVAPAETHSNLPPTTGVLHKVLGVYLTQGLAETAMSTTIYTPIGPSTPIKCTQVKGCTLIVANMVQYSPTGSGTASICTMVDGIDAHNCGVSDGPVSASDVYKTFNDQEYYTMSEGDHTVQLYGYLSGGGEAYWYQSTYTLTTP